MIKLKRCSVEGCGGKHMARGYCNIHYQELLRHGSPLAGGTHKTPKGEAREWLLTCVAHAGAACLPWPFSLDDKGYGQIVHEGRPWKASRLMCVLTHGEPPSDGHEAAHSCGRRDCINPQHLRWATPAENQADKILHGTTNRGSRAARVKLTEEQVREILDLKGKCPQREIGKRFGVSRTTVSSIHAGYNWGWLE